MKIPKIGSRWAGNGNDTFHILNTIELEGKTWIHYIKENTKEASREYSCYLESFLARFRELPD